MTGHDDYNVRSANYDIAARVAGHYIQLRPTRAPNGHGWQSYAHCQCGWGHVALFPRDALNAARAHLASVTPPNPGPLRIPDNFIPLHQPDPPARSRRNPPSTEDTT